MLHDENCVVSLTINEYDLLLQAQDRLQTICDVLLEAAELARYDADRLFFRGTLTSDALDALLSVWFPEERDGRLMQLKVEADRADWAKLIRGESPEEAEDCT